MSVKEKTKYLKEKRKVFEALCIPLSDESFARMEACQNEVAIDNIAHSIIMNHQYAR